MGGDEAFPSVIQNGVPLRRHGSSQKGPKWLHRHQYIKGSIPHNKGQKSTGTTSPVQCLCPIRRLSKEEFHDNVQQQKNGIFTVSDAERRSIKLKILRPGPSEVQPVDSYIDAESPNPNSKLYKVLHQEKTAKLWNHAFKEHSQKFPDCDGSLDWNQHGEEKRGLAWILSIRCKKCLYTSHREKLYEEVSQPGRGRRAAQLNVAMAVSHLGTSLTTEGMRGMLLGANIKPASATNIHQTCPGHEDCTATIPPETTIGDEKRWAAECIGELQSDDRPLVISHFTSDGDSAAVSGASLMKRAMSSAVGSIISCYQGQCGKSCQLYSFSCRGSIGVMEIQHWNFVNL